MKRKYSDDQLREAVASSVTISQVIKKLGNRGCGGGTYLCIKANIKRLGLNTSHFVGMAWLRGKQHNWSSKPIEEYFIVGTKLIRGSFFRSRLIKEGIWKDECHICGLKPIWNGKPLSLQVHHMNGNKMDNRLENIKLTCPNCHSQTPNFTGRRLKKTRKPMKSELNPNWRRTPRVESRKVMRPSKEELSALIKSTPWTSIGKMFGVTDNAVRKWARCYGLTRNASEQRDVSVQ